MRRGPGRGARGARRAAALAALCAGCATFAGVAEGRRALEVPGRAAAETTNGANASLVYAARTSVGVVVVDLGWSGGDAALRRALERLGATPAEVVAVLLTHSHRDHVGAWPLVAHAPFWVGAGERARLLGEASHGGWIPRWADRLRRPRLPGAGALVVHELRDDTALVFGADTVRAFPLPGHTAGSMAWLLRGVLFAGDGVSHDKTSGALRAARPAFSDDAALARRSLVRLRAAARPHGVRLVCTAHARCRPADAALWQRLAPRP